MTKDSQLEQRVTVVDGLQRQFAFEVARLANVDVRAILQTVRGSVSAKELERIGKDVASTILFLYLNLIEQQTKRDSRFESLGFEIKALVHDSFRYVVLSDSPFLSDDRVDLKAAKLVAVWSASRAVYNVLGKQSGDVPARFQDSAKRHCYDSILASIHATLADDQRQFIMSRILSSVSESLLPRLDHLLAIPPTEESPTAPDGESGDKEKPGVVFGGGVSWVSPQAGIPKPPKYKPIPRPTQDTATVKCSACGGSNIVSSAELDEGWYWCMECQTKNLVASSSKEHVCICEHCGERAVLECDDLSSSCYTCPTCQKTCDLNPEKVEIRPADSDDESGDKRKQSIIYLDGPWIKPRAGKAKSPKSESELAQPRETATVYCSACGGVNIVGAVELDEGWYWCAGCQAKNLVASPSKEHVAICEHCEKSVVLDNTGLGASAYGCPYCGETCSLDSERVKTRDR